MPVGEPRPTSTVPGSESKKYAGHLASPLRQPNSAPAMQWFTRMGRYQYAPTSHSMSASNVNMSPAELNAKSYSLRNPLVSMDQCLPSGVHRQIVPPGALIPTAWPPASSNFG